MLYKIKTSYTKMMVDRKGKSPMESYVYKFLLPICYLEKIIDFLTLKKSFIFLVGATGFEPVTR